MDLLNELQQKIKELNISIKKLRETGTTYAESEKEYKIAVNKKALELRENGVPVTLIQTVIYGYPEIAKLRFERDVAEVIYNANQEAIQSTKLQIRVLENQISREFGNGGIWFT